MWIESVNEKNLSFTGLYSTAVGRPTPEEKFPLNGNFQRSNDKMCVISWIVNWKNETKEYNSIASFNGYAVFGDKEIVTIHTNWLLSHLDT